MTEFRAWVCLVSLGCLTACTEETELTPFHIGVVAPVTGPLTQQGLELVSAATLAVDHINSAGGVVGRRIALRVEDDGGTTQGAAEAVSRLIAQGVDVFVGSVGTPLSRAVAAAAAESGHTLIVPNATSSSFRLEGEEVSESWPVLRVCGSDTHIASGLVDALVEDGMQRVGVVVESNAYGQDMSALLSERLLSRGLVSVGVEVWRGNEDDAKLLATLLEAQADAIILAVGPVAGGSLVSTLAAGFSDQPVKLYLPDALANDSFIGLAGASAISQQSHVGVRLSDWGPWHVTFRDLFQRAYGYEPVEYQGHAFDAVVIAAIALGIQQSQDAQGLWRALVDTDVSGIRIHPSNLSAVLSSMVEAQMPLYDGATGTLMFDSRGDVSVPVVRWAVVDGVITMTNPP